MKHHDAFHALLSEAQKLSHEGHAASGDHAALKLWLRMLASTTHIEVEIRTRLRERFGISLARLDCMAQMSRYKSSLKMRALSRYLMVTGGNVIGLTDELEADGIVLHQTSPEDHRVWIVWLTPKGRRAFEGMATEHEQWILNMFAVLDTKPVQQLYTHLGVLRVQLARNDSSAEEKP